MSQLSTKQLEATVGGVVALIAVVSGIAYTSRRLLNKPDNSNKGIELTNSNPLAPNITGSAQGGLPGQAPNPLPGQAPINAPGQAPNPLPGQAPNPLPGQAPNPLPGQAPNPLPGQAPIALPGQAPIALPGQAPINAPGQAPIALPGQAPINAPSSQGESTASPLAGTHHLEVDGEIVALPDGSQVGRLVTPPLSQPNDILRVMVEGHFHSLVNMPPFSEGGREIFFDATARDETDAPQPAIDRPANYSEEEDDPSVLSRAPSSSTISNPSVGSFGRPPSSSGFKPAGASINDPNVGFFGRAPSSSGFKPAGASISDPRLDPVSELSEGSGMESQESAFSGITGGSKKTKSKKKPKKKTRKYHKIISQVKKLLKEV